MLAPSDLANQRPSQACTTERDRALRTEHDRLLQENHQLRQSLVAMQENASLRTAHVLASLIAWSDEQIATRAKKFLLTDALNNNYVKSRSSATSPFRPISPARLGQPPYQESGQKPSASPWPNGQYASVATQDSGQTLQTAGTAQCFGPTLQNAGTPQGFGPTLQNPGTPHGYGPNPRYSPTNYGSVIPPSVVVNRPRSPSPVSRRRLSQSPIPPPELPRSSPAMSSNSSRNRKILTPTSVRNNDQSYSTQQKQLPQNTVQIDNRKQIPELSSSKLTDSASDIDDRLERLLSRQVVQGSYGSGLMNVIGQGPGVTGQSVPGQGQAVTGQSVPGQGQGVTGQDHLEMSWPSFSDRRIAFSGNMNQTFSEGYGSVASVGQYNGVRSGSGETSGSMAGGGQMFGGGQSRQSNIPVASVARKAVGDPIATSTPVRAGGTQPASSRSDPRPSVASQIAGSSVLHRPIDSVIGFRPVLTEAHRRKLSRIKASRRLIGEVAFQLDRRILEYVFTSKFFSDKKKRKRYYGFSIANTGQMIRKEASGDQGKLNTKTELEMRYRFDYIIKTLSSFGYMLEKHGQFAQDMVNKYGLLNAPPDTVTVKEFGLEDPVILRVLLSQLIDSDVELQDELVLLDCLCLLAHDDRKSIFMW